MKVLWKILKWLSICLAVAVFSYGGYLLLAERDAAPPLPAKPAEGARIVMSMEGFRFMLSENGGTSWRMQARKADLFENKEARLKDIEIGFTGADEKEAVLLGEAANMDTVTGNASIHSGEREVRIVTSDGYLLTTDSLFWKAGERLVRSPDAFKLLGSEIYLEGKELSGHVDVTRIVVNSNVKAVLQE